MIQIVNVPIYKTTVVMIAETSEEEWLEFYKLYDDKITEDDSKYILKDINNPDTCNGATFILDKGDYVIFIRHKDYEGDVAHEIFHVANKILCSRGVFHEADGEAWAYLIGWLTEQYYDMLRDPEREGVFTLQSMTTPEESKTIKEE